MVMMLVIGVMVVISEDDDTYCQSIATNIVSFSTEITSDKIVSRYAMI